MKLTGWYRIGIVLSVLWCFVITGVVISEYNHPTRYSSFVTLEPDTNKPIPPSSKGGGSLFDEIDRLAGRINWEYETKTVINYGNIFSSMIIPLVMGWILVLTIVWTIKWIMRGFKSRPSKS